MSEDFWELCGFMALVLGLSAVAMGLNVRDHVLAACGLATFVAGYAAVRLR